MESTGQVSTKNERTKQLKTTVLYHAADYDGIFCREIARKFLPPDTEFIGWDFADKPLEVPPEGTVYIMDLPVDKVFGWTMPNGWGAFVKYDGFKDRLIWIDHHKSSIESHPQSIPGYRIDGVAACRLAWQWFNERAVAHPHEALVRFPTKQEFIDRKVSEPLSVRLAGEYDVWDKRDDRADVFQFGLRSLDIGADFWEALLSTCDSLGDKSVGELLENGYLLQRYQTRNDSNTMSRSFHTWFEGLHLLCLNTARCNSNTFTALDRPETGHDALCGFYFNGKKWTVSLYHAKHRTDLDLSKIAVKYGGGGHRGACGFTTEIFPFTTAP